ncbi:2-amino-4-hydroxy-6-hydroxymethyldihydropteridine diphosphokinase [Neobacillus sp. SM06]|uniref:2-amino-4-hydroxy-6- hydroxymethyldihydropteridine diphosphokinase n=1 Tax=Neobacillus sp. SM06 TaxID=3422492 RepID=UPI003D2B1F3C
MENTAFVGLGSNIGDRYQYLVRAIQLLANHPEIFLVNYSSVYETDPVGYEDQDLFLNMVIEIKTSLSAEMLLEACLQIECQLGRKREIKWGPRTIDLDILLYNQENIETEKLIIPHPRMAERAFVMVPLIEIKPDLQFPGKEQFLHLDVDQLLDTEGVRIWKQKSGEDVFALIES